MPNAFPERFHGNDHKVKILNTRKSQLARFEICEYECGHEYTRYIGPGNETFRHSNTPECFECEIACKFCQVLKFAVTSDRGIE